MRRAGGFAIALAVAACAPGAGPDPRRPPALDADPAAPPTETCAAEAVMLLEPVELRRAPAASAPKAQRLAAGTYVFLCGARDGFLAIQHPLPGAPVDCAGPEARRSCALGWTGRAPRTETLG